jgi:RHS repeat-associated protein
MGEPQGSFVRQSFTLTSAGIFSISDDHGNFFSLSVPIAASGGSTSTLLGNSTTAVLEALVTAGHSQLADVTLTFSVYRQSCQPAGVRLVISGTEDWGPSGKGAVEVQFNQNALSLSGDRAWFGNSSGVALGFDWSDSAALGPSYNSTANAVSWSVGDSFTIDPVTVTTSTSSTPTEFSYQTHLCSASGRTWVFYFGGASYDFVSSVTGLSGNWSSPTSIPTSGGVGAGGLGVACSGSAVYRATPSASSAYGWWFDSGTLNSNGTISWGTEVQISPTGNYQPKSGNGGPTVALDTSGRVWAGVITSSSDLQIWGCSSSCGVASSWADSYNSSGGTVPCAQLLPLTSARLAVVYQARGSCGGGGGGGGGGGSGGTGNIYIQTYDGNSTWSSAVEGPTSMGSLAASQYAALGDAVEGCAPGNTLYYSSFMYGASSWSPAVSLDSSSSGIQSCAVSTDGKSTVAVTYVDDPGGMKYILSTSSGASWGAAFVLDPYETSAGYMSGTLTFSTTVAAVYESGASSPYSIRYFAWPVTMPTAANTKYSWGKLGLSPYESYFQNFGEFLSTGNGLLTVVMGTASVPSRGVDLEAGLVYTSPYTFTPSGSVYQFENFSLAKLGVGWALDVPWLGPNYVHLPGGEAIPYAWSGPSMTYHGDTDFTLVDYGTNGYNLTMKDGTVYTFNSAQQLTKETDYTGNNSLTFAYGTNGYLSSMTDPLNRQITFGYNANSYLSTVTSAGRTWTLAYSSTSPAQLASVTDPLDRATTFQYAGTSGANLWLTNAILYPTGGKTTYAYGNMPYGTEADYFYVTARDSYSSADQLVRTDSVNYTIVNAQVTWSNMTSSDGLGVQVRIETNYTPSIGAQKVYDLDSAGTIVRVTENDYDGAGRVTTTKLESPSGAVLAASSASFDDWGNTIYTKGFMGQQTYYSYANTDTSGFFTNSSAYQGSAIPITLANDQSSPTAEPFQQEVTFSPQKYSANESSNLGNIRFCADRSCTIELHAWLESCSPSCGQDAQTATVWVRLNSSIPADGQMVIWMHFNSTSTDFDGDYWGEAPTLSSAYAEYDNGGEIFSWYENFAGSSLPSDMSVANIGTNNWSVSNGLTITPSAVGLGGVFYKSTPISAAVIDSYLIDTFSNTASATVGLQLAAPQSQGSYGLWPALANSYVSLCSGADCGYHGLYKDLSGAAVGIASNAGLSTGGSVFTIQWPATGTESTTLNYADELSSTDSSLTRAGAVYPVIADYGNSGTTSTTARVGYQWVRARAYPPGGVMPAAYVGYVGEVVCSASFYSQSVSSSIADIPVGECTFQDGIGSAQQDKFYMYDRSGNLLEQKVSHDGGWLSTNSTYDDFGNVLSATDAEGRTSYYSYSSTYGSAYLTEQSTLVGTQNVVTTNTYDRATGNLLSTTDPNGQTTSYQYDALGRVTVTTYPAVSGISATTRSSYDDANNVLTTTDANGHVTREYFDGLARETELQLWNGSSAYSTVYYTYNWLDQVATKTTATGNTYYYGYDWDGRLVNLTNPDGTHELTSYNDTLNTKTVTDENGQLTLCQYNWDGLLTSVKEYNTTSTYYLTTYSYDPSGNMLSATDAKGQTTTYQYDDLNRLVKTTFPDGTYETKTYDSFGNLLTRMTANGSTISYSYDALNRLILVSYPGSGGNATYTYDADGNRLSQVSPPARDYYTYDARGRLTNQTEYVDGQKTQTLYAYDQAGNVVQITYPDGYVLSMGYDGVGRLNSIGRFANITYTLDGQISKIAYGNGEMQTYTYDRRDRPTQILVMYGTTKELDLNYTYDGTGNMLTENSQSYGYDALNRLNYTSGPWGTITYTYDAVGNRVQMVNGSTVTNYTYGEFNRLTSAGNVNYTYDANGNMIAKSGGWTYSYDYENRLTAVSRNGVTVQQNYYDGDGNRVEQVSGNASTIYSYQGVNILYQKNLTSDTIVKSFYAGGIQVAQMVNYTTYYLHQDALGSTRLVMPTSMVSSFSSNYIPYGMNFAMMGSEEYQYTGKLMDVVTGLYYEGARYYDPTTGRFITEDSVVGSINDPMSLNRYVYARDNPMKIVDMNGHEWWNPVADLTTAASDVVGAATDVANSVSNAWNSLPPAVSTAAQSTVSFLQTTLTQVSQGVSSESHALLDETAGALSSVAGILSSATTQVAGLLTVIPASAISRQIASGVSSCLTGVCGAVAVAITAGLGAVSTGALIGGAISAGTGAVASLGGVALGVGLLSFGAGFAIGYVIKNGYNSTPQGAWKAFGAGLTLQPAFHPENPTEPPSWWPTSPLPLPSPLSSLSFL